MDLSEFKAWFEGFTESMNSPPNKKQWDRIKEKIDAIDGRAVVYREYVDRWIARPWRHTDPWITYCNGMSVSNGIARARADAADLAVRSTGVTWQSNADVDEPLNATTFNSHGAMNMLW